jgi:hypothetical protein
MLRKGCSSSDDCNFNRFPHSRLAVAVDSLQPTQAEPALITEPARDTVTEPFCLHWEVHMLSRKLAAVLLLLVSSVASAAWPEKAVRIIIPWPPGGSTDIVGRILAAGLT